MKVVRVRHFGDNTAREFLFETPKSLDQQVTPGDARYPSAISTLQAK